MKARFDELLPWYVNGSLGADERAWVERYLADHPESRAELDWYRSLARNLHDKAPEVPATLGLAKVMSRIDAERPDWTERLTAWLGTLGLRPAAAFAGLAIFAVQGAVIVSLLRTPHDEASEVRAVGASTTDERPMLKLNFTPDAKEAEIRHLLMSVQGRLAGGPGQLGDYYVTVPAGREAALADRLKNNPIVTAVSVAPGLPSRD
jgi:anti-sigma-K factor RskA